MKKRTSVVIFAAGRGTKMKSRSPKVLHKVGGIPMISRTLGTLKKAGFKDVSIVVGYKKNQIKQAVNLKFKGAKFTEQLVLDGTGGSLKTFWKELDVKPNYVIAMNGDDSFLYSAKTLRWLLNKHVTGKHGMSILTCKLDREFNYRKVYRNSSGNFKFFTKNPSQRGEIICGLYVFSKNYLNDNIGLLKKKDKTGEYEIVDFMYLKTNYSVGAYRLKNPTEWYGVNTKADLVDANKLYKDLHENYAG